MGTLRELFEKREIIISLRNDNEGPDWSSFLTVQYIIDNQDIFGNFFLQYPLNGIDMLINMLRLISELMKVDKTIVQTQCYGAAMFACALIEKVMRIAYQRIAKNDKYIPIEKATLGEMLSTNNPYFVAIFGEYHLKNLSYYLTHIPPEKIGRNYRNALAHWADITVDTLEPFLVYKLLWLLCDVMVTLILF